MENRKKEPFTYFRDNNFVDMKENEGGSGELDAKGDQDNVPQCSESVVKLTNGRRLGDKNLTLKRALSLEKLTEIVGESHDSQPNKIEQNPIRMVSPKKRRTTPSHFCS